VYVCVYYIYRAARAHLYGVSGQGQGGVCKESDVRKPSWSYSCKPSSSSSEDGGEWMRRAGTSEGKRAAEKNVRAEAVEGDKDERDGGLRKVSAVFVRACRSCQSLV
jgi:hypothetical protein